MARDETAYETAACCFLIGESEEEVVLKKLAMQSKNRRFLVVFFLPYLFVGAKFLLILLCPVASGIPCDAGCLVIFRFSIVRHVFLFKGSLS